MYNTAFEKLPVFNFEFPLNQKTHYLPPLYIKVTKLFSITLMIMSVCVKDTQRFEPACITTHPEKKKNDLYSHLSL